LPSSAKGEGIMSRFWTGTPQDSTMDDAQQQSKPPDTPAPVAGDAGEEPISSLRSVRSRGEIEAIRTALNRTGWNRKQAARLLKISYRGLLYKIRQHNITAA
jgi:two-component system response regulator AtoC